jgi:tetratricopeptide (TPR) repeat protein
MFMAICRPAIFFSLICASLIAGAAAPNSLGKAREYYKNGDYLKAAETYEKIPLQSSDYLRSREELAWAYLRAGDWTKLRGVLAHLNTALVPLRWRLEGRVMSAMLHLRECQYDQVRKEISMFQAELAPLAKKVDENSKSSPHAAYWNALREETAEAMLKMKFVRMELRSRLVMLGREQVVDAQNTKGLSDKIPSGKQTFPLDEDLWVDEVFQGRGTGRVACAEIHKGKVPR